MIKPELSGKIEPVLRKHEVAFAGIFGSRARGDERTDSDVDLLVRFTGTKSLLDLIELEQDLSQTLQLSVDVVTEGALSPLLKTSVFRDLHVLYGKR